MAACVEPDALRFCFDLVTADTLARGAELAIETIALQSDAAPAAVASSRQVCLHRVHAADPMARCWNGEASCASSHSTENETEATAFTFRSARESDANANGPDP
jgi:Zn finger protein HypA/HybF involved in hydrogenase expression